MAETLDFVDALKMTTSPSQSHRSLPSSKVQSSNEGEIEEALLDDTNNNQNNSLKEPECGFSGYEQDSEVEMETLRCCEVVQDSPSGDVPYDAAFVSSDVIVPEIQESPSSCVLKFSDEAVDSRTETGQEGNFADYAVDSINVKKQEEECADGAIDTLTVTKQEGNFSDAVDSITVQKQEKLESLDKCLKIQVIDETAVIELPCHRNGMFNNGKHQETQGKKEKRPKRRRSKAAEKVETSGTSSQDCGYVGYKGKKRLVYSRKEMEDLRFVGLEAQKNKWIEIYCGLDPLVAKEYDELAHHQKHNATGFDFDPRPQFLRASMPPRSFDAVAARRKGNHLKVSVH